MRNDAEACYTEKRVVISGGLKYSLSLNVSSHWTADGTEESGWRELINMSVRNGSFGAKWGIHSLWQLLNFPDTTLFRKMQLDDTKWK